VFKCASTLVALDSQLFPLYNTDGYSDTDFAEPETTSPAGLSSQRRQRLIDRCRACALPVTGTKKELVQRLLKFLQEHPVKSQMDSWV